MLSIPLCSVKLGAAVRPPGVVIRYPSCGATPQPSKENDVTPGCSALLDPELGLKLADGETLSWGPYSDPSLRPEKENGHANTMLDLTGSRAEE